MKRRLVVVGIGGQGVVYASKVLAHAALLRSESVVSAENHGMSQRGGSVMAHVKIGGGQAPLIARGTADVLLALDRTEAIRQLTFVGNGGQVFVNGDDLPTVLAERLAERGIGLHLVPATRRALELGQPAAANLVLLGRAAAHPALGLSLDDLRAAVRTLGPARAVDGNLTALEAGAAEAVR